jgi:very-short-patch-repair endonuclease
LLKTLRLGDFVCKRIRLVVEIDGNTHYADAGIAHDARRTERAFSEQFLSGG